MPRPDFCSLCGEYQKQIFNKKTQEAALMLVSELASLALAGGFEQGAPDLLTRTAQFIGGPALLYEGCSPTEISQQADELVADVAERRQQFEEDLIRHDFQYHGELPPEEQMHLIAGLEQLRR